MLIPRTTHKDIYQSSESCTPRTMPKLPSSQCLVLTTLHPLVALSVAIQVTRSEAGILLGLYVVYVAATFYFSRADEPLHADLALREFPPEDGGIGGCDKPFGQHA
jgi:hypothetical protein